MVATPSVMLPLGTEVPDFGLPNAVDGRIVSPTNYRGAVGLVVMFICNHCPFVKHVVQELTRLSGDYRDNRERSYYARGLGVRLGQVVTISPACALATLSLASCSLLFLSRRSSVVLSTSESRSISASTFASRLFLRHSII